MKKARSLLIAAAVVGLAATSWLAYHRGPDTGPPSPAPIQSSGRSSGPGRPPMPEDPDAPPFIWCRRVGEEVIAMVRNAVGQPDAGTTLRFVGPTGAGQVSPVDEKTDSFGVFRGTVSGVFQRIFVASNGEPGGFAGPVGIPGESPANRAMLADQTELRPGDRFRVCIRVANPPEPGQPLATLRFEPAQGDDPAAPLLPAMEEGRDPGGPDAFPCWKVFEGTVPDDAPVGSAVVACGTDELRIPVVPRFGPGTGTRSAIPPDTPPTSPSDGALALEGRDGEWHAKGPFDATVILFFAEAGDRLLVHQGAIAIDGEAAAALPLGDHPPTGARVTAVAATPKGFLEASVPVPGADGESPPPSDSDAVLAAFLAEPRRAEPPPPGPEAEPAMESRGAAVRPGLPEALFRPGEIPDPETAVRWEIEPRGVAGALRIRCGPAILIEARVGGGGDGDSGTLRAGDIGGRPVLVESSAPGLKAVAFSWSAQPATGDSPPRPGRLVTLERALPTRGRRGEEAECRIVLRVSEPCLCTVTCPVPGGTVPAEDGWSVRARAPAGTRVGVKAGAVSFLVPMEKPGEAVLSFRIRPASKGRFNAPAASVSCSDLARPGAPLDRAYSASGVLDVE